MTPPRLSIAIPTYECHGFGWLFLTELLNSIVKQNTRDFEVIISDQSTDQGVKEVCDLYQKHLSLTYVSGHHVGRSNSPNTNNAIRHCTSPNIKIMFQDDFFIHPDAVTQFTAALSGGSQWVVCASTNCTNIHSMNTLFIPKYTDRILDGQNTISSPSVLGFVGPHFFDENLIMAMDCDLYARLYHQYGAPTVLGDVLICNRHHPHQLQNEFQDKLAVEVDYMKQKYQENVNV